MKATNFYVYGYLRAVTSERGEAGTYYYIGKGRGNRAYSKDRLVPVPKDRDRIVIIVDNLTEEEAFKLEIQLISKYGRIDEETGILHNLTNGGEGSSGYRFTDEQRAKRSKYYEDPENRAKRSAAVKKYYENPEARAKNSAAMKKYLEDPENRAKHSASHNTSEVRAKISAAMKKYLEDPENRAKHSAAMYTPEANAKRSVAVKKYYENPEARAKTSAAMKIIHNTPEARANNSAAQKLAWIKRKDKALNESQETQGTIKHSLR